MKTKNVARAVILVAIAVALSPVFIPVGISKCFPAQHMVNVIGAVMLGPWYAVAIAAIAGKEEIMEALQVANYISGIGCVYTASLGLAEVFKGNP